MTNKHQQSLRLIFSFFMIFFLTLSIILPLANALEWRSKQSDDDPTIDRRPQTAPRQEPRQEPARDRLQVDNQQRLEEEKTRMEEAAKARRALRERTSRTSPPAQNIQTMPPGGNEPGINVIPPQMQPPTMPGGPQRPQQQQAQSGERPQNAILYMQPVTQTVDVGETFTLSLKLDNPKDVSFDKLGVTLSYDPNLLAIVPFEGLLEGEVVRSATSGLIQPGMSYDLLLNRVDSKRGLIYYHMHLKSGDTRRFKGVLGDIRFQALAQTQSTLVKFITSNAKEDVAGLKPGQPQTYLLSNGEDVLGQTGVQEDGTLSTNIRISQKGSDAARVITTEKVRSRARPRDEEPLSISIVPSMLSVKEGEDFIVRLRLNNSGERPFDYLGVLLQFDPKHIRILDWDEGNWIKTGINIHDGSFHTDFPFDLARANRVFRSSQGVFIDYRHGGYRFELTSDGYFANIHAQALRPAELTRMVFRFQRNGMEPTTGVFLDGENLLGESEEETMAVEGFQLQILPSQAARANGK